MHKISLNFIPHPLHFRGAKGKGEFQFQMQPLSKEVNFAQFEFDFFLLNWILVMTFNRH